jgi:hypothetical protein
MQVQAATIRGAYAGRAAGPSVCETSVFTGRVEDSYDFTVEGRGCAKGILVSVCLEAAAMLCAYGIWQFWHMLK